jgi:hypothetical protein
MPGDYDGDGRTDVAFWRPNSQAWYVILTSNPGYTFISSFATATATATANAGANVTATPFSLAPFAKAPGVNLAARQTPNSQYTISGTVATSGGAAVPGVQVIATTQYASLQMNTDSAGAYSFTVPANSNLTLSLSLANYTFSSSPYSSAATLSGNVAQNFTATPSSGPSSYTFYGQVNNSSSSTALPTVTMTLTGPGSYSSSSQVNATGGYASPSLSTTGTYTLTPSAAGYSISPPSVTFSISSAGISPSSQTFTATPVSSSYTFYGQVNNSSSSTALPTVTMTLTGPGSYSSSSSANSTGGYASPPLSAIGTYTLTPAAAGYSISPTSVTFSISSAGISPSSQTFAATRTVGGSLDSSAPAREYIRLGGQVVAVESPH